jgi:hypothetical protein
MTAQLPTFDELVDALTESGRRYGHIDAIEDPDDRLQAAREALPALVPAERRAGAGSLAVTIEQAGRFSESAFMEEEIRVVARHFGPLEPAILAVHDHVKETTSNQGRCSCPAGQATADD